MKPIVYLSGGFHSGWQHKVRERCSAIEFVDPSGHGLKAPQEYTAWDLYHLAKSDVVLAYMEDADFPAYGLVLEVGFARAKGKLILLVDERSRLGPEDKFTRHFAIVRAASDLVFGALDNALAYLESLVTGNPDPDGADVTASCPPIQAARTLAVYAATLRQAGS